ncbi:MAG TPA: hypothetical protein H9903_15010 [Candidatus Aquabacterium excrementipullorum]|nr:hypothetical protein [Candidatus Aquabacterium excrementipullorum]
MNKEPNQPGPDHFNSNASARPRKPFESTYGYPTHQDGIQSGNLTSGDAKDPPQSQDERPVPSGPGSRDGNAM